MRSNVARLRSVFERAILAACAATGSVGAHACANAAHGGGSAADASASMDASASTDGRTAEAAVDAGSGLWPPGCEPGAAEPFDAGGDVEAGCEFAVPLPCGLPPWVTALYVPGCVFPSFDCAKICPPEAGTNRGCRVANGYGCDDDAGAFVAADGSPILVECSICAGAGRRPPGLVAPGEPTAGDALGVFLARAAHLEAASVHAFVALADELRAHRAPPELVEWARASARDEARHARVMRRLARAHGSEPARPRVRRSRRRTLLEIAIDNGREGCVRETFAALVATWQARHACDRKLAEAMRRIASDETNHSELSWALSRWLESRLDPSERKLVAARVREEVSALKREIRSRPHAALIASAGLPSSGHARCLLDRLDAALWSGAADGVSASV